MSGLRREAADYMWQKRLEAAPACSTNGISLHARYAHFAGCANLAEICKTVVASDNDAIYSQQACAVATHPAESLLTMTAHRIVAAFVNRLPQLTAARRMQRSETICVVGWFLPPSSNPSASAGSCWAHTRPASQHAILSPCSWLQQVIADVSTHELLRHTFAI